MERMLTLRWSFLTVKVLFAVVTSLPIQLRAVP
jgi:hypothetical protein